MYQQVNKMATLVHCCHYCNVDFDKSDTLRKHMKRKHNENSAERNIKCAEDDCNKDFFNILAYRKHLEFDHSFQMVVRTEQFQTENEFLEWKKDFEHETNERYVKNKGIKKSASGVSRIFDCHRSGFEKKKTLLEADRTELLQGPGKLNSRCPAQMILKENDNCFELTFYSTHTHATEICHVNLAEKACETIAGMMKSGLSQKYILDFYKAKPTSHSDHWVDEKDLRQIAKRFHLGHEWRSHSEDAKSVHLFVEENRGIVSFHQPEVKQDNKIEKEFILVLHRKTSEVSSKQT